MSATHLCVVKTIYVFVVHCTWPFKLLFFTCFLSLHSQCSIDSTLCLLIDCAFPRATLQIYTEKKDSNMNCKVDFPHFSPDSSFDGVHLLLHEDLRLMSVDYIIESNGSLSLTYPKTYKFIT
ncbi:hypothetical protein L1887_27645 [Cichorium endivia]|nr:hypothetical protein L1887_27645 [Cichorium endivia]